MKVNLTSQRNKVITVALFFLFGVGLTYGQTTVKVTLLDNTEQSYSVEPDGKLWFNNSDLIINPNNLTDPITVSLSDIRKITFKDNENTTGIREVVKTKADIHIFPNPTHNYFDIQSSGTEKLNVHIFNTNGTLVTNGTYVAGNRVDISHLTTGVYIVVINNQSFKLIKQ